MDIDRMPTPEVAIRRPDAMIVPAGWGTADPEKFRREIGPTLARPHLSLSNCGAFNLVFGHAVHPEKGGVKDYELHFGQGHPRAGEPRYDWFRCEKGADGTFAPTEPVDSFRDGGAALLLGYRRGDDFADDPRVIEAMRDRREAAGRALADRIGADPAFAADLERRGIGNPKETAGQPA